MYLEWTKLLFPPTPFLRVPLYLLVGSLRDAPYVDENEVELGKRSLCYPTLDHRFVDGAQAAVLAKKLREAFAKRKGDRFADSEIKLIRYKRYKVFL